MKAPSRPAHRAGAVALVVAAVFALSCSEASQPPVAIQVLAVGAEPASGSILEGLHLLQCQPQAYDSVTQTVGSSGGTIDVGSHSLVIPEGALDSNITITAVAPSVNRREVNFQPEGLTFNTPATLTLSYNQCSLPFSILPKKIVYTNADLDPLELITSLDNLLTKTVTGDIEHFSGYVVWY